MISKIKLSPEIIENFNIVSFLLKGHSRYVYSAELSKKLFDNSPREMEKVLKVGRDLVRLEVDERQTIV